MFVNTENKIIEESSHSAEAVCISFALMPFKKGINSFLSLLALSNRAD